MAKVQIRKWLEYGQAYKDRIVARLLPPERFEVHDTDNAEHAAHLACRTALAEGMHAMPTRPVLHGDRPRRC